MKTLKEEEAFTQALYEEFKQMKNINTLKEFKDLILTCNFWADTWAISTLERVLNIKLIIFSQEYFDAGDFNNVLLCGHLSDPILSESGKF